MLGAALSVLLPPISAMAQCDFSAGWYKHISGLPDGQVGGYRQNPTILSNPVEDSFYLVLEYWHSDQIQINGSVSDVNSCEGTGRGILVQKYQIDGQLIWEVETCDESTVGLVEGAAVGDDGSVYVGGKYSESMIVENVSIGTSSNISYFVFKISPDGQLGWVMTDEDAASGAVGLTWTDHGLLTFIAVSDSVSFNGNTYYNQSGSSTPDRDFVVLMVDENGEVVWHQMMSGIGNPAIYSAGCNDELCIVQGRFGLDEGELSYGGQLITAVGAELFQIVFNVSDGTLEWIDRSSDNGNVYANSLSILQDSLVVTGGLYHDELFYRGHEITEQDFGSDGFVMLQNLNDGEVYWLNGFGGEREDDIMDVAVAGNRIFISGAFASSVVNYQGLMFTNQGIEVEDPFVMELDLEGKPQCIVQGLGTQAEDMMPKVTIINDHLYTLLTFRDSTVFNGISINSLGTIDAVLWKTCLPCDTLTSITETTTTAPALQLYPNPVATQTQLTYHTAHGGQPTLLLTDMLGRVLKTVQLPSNEGTYALDASTLGAGVYFCTLLNGTEVLATQKLSVIYNE